MNDQVFEVHAPGADVARIVDEIRAAVDRKRADGCYADPRVARAERFNLTNLRNDEDFFALYVDCLREAFVVDINDFEIVERRPRFNRLLVGLKRRIWSILKFYTYRLWSQQNQINGLLLTAVEGLDQKYRDRIRELESRLAALESRRGEHDAAR
jgi:hypothetical protein